MVLYQGERPHARAAEVCNELVSRFWPRAELQFRWFALDQLLAPAVRRAAAAACVEAEIIVCAIEAEEDVPSHVADWFDELVGLRLNREGVFIGLVGCGGETSEKKLVRLEWLRRVARRAGMDFLAEAIPTGAWTIPESFQWLEQRAGQLSPVLCCILGYPAAPFMSSSPPPDR
ncbi:MAG: hypothetical protein N2379_05165 [Verrucomicrobiae bacterium]|nr:hypothetical protein [Verrucomicrobiae bacterium]